MKIIRVGTPEFERSLEAIRNRRYEALDQLTAKVDVGIKNFRDLQDDYLINEIKSQMDISLTRDQIWVNPDSIKNSHRMISASLRQSIEHARDRIARFHDELKPSSFQMEDEEGVLWGSELRPLDRVGIYVPGSRANYFLTLLLSAVPARLAGVKTLIVATPPNKSLGSPYVSAPLLYTAKIMDIQDILLSSSVAGLSALCFGIQRSAPCQKIVGSGGKLTVVAKERLSGYCDTDGMTGPLEVAFICNKTTQIRALAADIVGHTERDAELQIYAFHTDSQWFQDLLHEIAQNMNEVTDPDSRASIQSALERNFFGFLVRNLDEAIEISNRIAPGLLCLPMNDAQEWLPKISACGSVLTGHFTPSVALDLIGGPTGLVHTMGTAAFSINTRPSSFMRRFNVVELNQAALGRFYKESAELSRSEGFTTHEACFKYRLESQK